MQNMPSAGLERALESLLLEKEVTADDIRAILHTLRASKGTWRKRQVLQGSRLKVMDSKCASYRKRIHELEDSLMTAQRQAESAMYHLETIRSLIIEASRGVDPTRDKLLELLHVIKKETECLGSKPHVTEEYTSKPHRELSEMEEYLDKCIYASRNRNSKAN